MSLPNDRLLTAILDRMERTERLVRFVAHRQARDLIEEHLTKTIERRVYELSDGIRSSRDIEKTVAKEVTQRTVVSWWQKWRKYGLVEQSRIYSGRMQQLMPLEELGLPLEVDE